jgi:hypothetical protein
MTSASFQEGMGGTPCASTSIGPEFFNSPVALVAAPDPRNSAIAYKPLRVVEVARQL